MPVDLFLQLIVLLIAARLMGEAAARIHQPAVVGEILSGILLSLIIAGFFSDVPILAALPQSETVRDFADLGVFFLVLYVGIDMQPRELSRHSGAPLAVAAGGLALPLAAGFGFGWLMLPDTPAKPALALLIAVALSISAVPVAAKIFMDLGLLHHRIGRTVVSAAIFDDLLGLVLLALLTAFVETGHLPDASALLWLLLKVAIFFAITVSFSIVVYRPAARWLGRLHSISARFSALLVVGLSFAVLAEVLGLHFILGAFMAGLFFERRRVGRHAYREIRETVNRVTSGFLGPIFFATIGLAFEPAAIAAVPVFVAALILIGCFGKFFGAGLPVLAAGYGWCESAAVGVGMSGRGVVTIIVASIALQSGLFGPAGGGRSDYRQPVLGPRSDGARDHRGDTDPAAAGG